MMNEMGNNPLILVISESRKSNLPIILSFFFGFSIRFLIGRNFGLRKVKLKSYFVMAGLHYGLKVDYSSFYRLNLPLMLQIIRRHLRLQALTYRV